MKQVRGRDVDGILLLDKPLGISSNAALQAAKRIFKARKAGHTGNLDVLATGLLPVCFGEASKFSGFMLNDDKCYAATFTLGTVTTTGDSEGEVIASCPVPMLEKDQVTAVLLRFTGSISQIPPMYSALHHQGQRLYDLAKCGITVERPARTVTIYDIHLQDIQENRLEVVVDCSKGTYIRTLAEDVGKAMGYGAFVSRLRRLRAGKYTIAKAYTLKQLTMLAEAGDDSLDHCLLPVDDMLTGFPAVNLTSAHAAALCQGQTIVLGEAPSGTVRLYDETYRFIGIGEGTIGQLSPRRLLKTKR